MAERCRSGDPCFNLRRWVYTVGTDEPELAVLLGLLAFMRLDVDLGKELSHPLSVGNVGGSSRNVLAERNVWRANNIVWDLLLQT